MAHSTSIPAGIVLSGKYKVGREIGRGGMATVFEALNIDIGKRVAIKALAGHLVNSPTVVERFLREARAVATVRSPHICDVYDAGRLDDGTPYLVLELLEGESLYDAMVRDRQMSRPVTLAIVLQLCRGLSKAHEAGIVHRDLKPENLFLTVDGDGELLLKILDFGLAKFYELDASEQPGKAARLTRDGAVFGTPVYMSPEQVRGQAAADARADLWAVACIAYECFTGTTVWSTEEGIAMIFAQIATASIPDPRNYRPDLPESFTAWFMRALDRDISRRFQTVQELADGLAAAFQYDRSGLDPGLIGRIAREARGQKVSVDFEPRPKRRRGAATPAAATPAAATRAAATQAAATPAAATPAAATPAARALGGAGGLEASSNGEASVVSLAGAVRVGVPGSVARGPTTPSSPVALHEDFEVVAPSRRSARLAALAVFVAAAAAIGFAIVDASAPSAVGVSAVRRFGELVLPLAERAPPAERTGFAHVATHPWLPRVRQAQVQISRGEHERAATALRRLFDETQHPMVKNLAEQAQIAALAQKSSARCQVTGLGRPRSDDLLAQDHRPGSAGSPAVALGIGGAVMAWAEPEGSNERLRAVPLDEALRNDGLVADVSPEAARVTAPFLLPIAQRFLLAYGDTSGSRPGAYVRWLAPQAAIAEAPLLVSASSAAAFDVRAARTPDGGFVVVWTEERGRGASALYHRRYDKDGRAIGVAARLGGESAATPIPEREHDAQIEIRDAKIYAVYTSSRGTTQTVNYLAAPLEGDGKPVRLVLSAPQEKASGTSLGCVPEGCYAAWGDALRAGASVGFVSNKTGKLEWFNRYTSAGKSPRIGVAPNGQSQLVWYEGGRVVGEPPAPSIAPGAQRGEWYIGWLDFESGRHEPYVVRVLCP